MGTASAPRCARRSSDRFLPAGWPSLAWRFKKLREQGKLSDDRPLTSPPRGSACYGVAQGCPLGVKIDVSTSRGVAYILNAERQFSFGIE